MAPRAFSRTPKQVEIMRILCAATARGEPLTLDELLPQLTYKPSRRALYCSVKFLEEHGFLVRIHAHTAGNSMTLSPTMKGYEAFKPRPE